MKKLDEKILETLDWVSSSFGSCEDEELSLQLTLRWSRVLSSIYCREYKKKNVELLQLVIKHCEFLALQLIEVKDSYFIEKYGPNILDTLLRLRECFELQEEMEKASEDEDSEALEFKLSDSLKDSMKKIELWSRAK